MITENLSTLKIHKLTQAQYDRELASGNIDENALYLTPEEETDLSQYATVEQMNGKADIDHNHDDDYYEKADGDALYDIVAAVKEDVDYFFKDALGDTDTQQVKDTLKEIQDYINSDADVASEVLESIANKADAEHTHTVEDITDLTATSTELNYMSGVTYGVQAQLDSKAASEHSHDDATESVAGFMTPTMVAKLNGISEGATKITVDNSLSADSMNPVQNKVITSVLSSATDAIVANTSSINSHSLAISNLQTAVSEFGEITSSEIQALFA